MHRDLRDVAAFLDSPLAEFAPWVADGGAGRSPQAEAYAASAHTKRRVFRAGSKVGKLAPLDEPVLTPDGWVPLGSLKTGDFVIAADGSETRVIGTFPQGKQKIYKVTFGDGAYTRCGLDHLWYGTSRNERRKHLPATVMPLREILTNWGARPRAMQRFRVPAIGKFGGNGATLPMDPYLVGALIGDGSLKYPSLSFTSEDAHIVDRVRAAVTAIGAEMKQGWKPIEYRFTSARGLKYRLGVLLLLGHGAHTKRIPPRYMLASFDQRLELMRGLMDTDGTVSKRGCCAYSTVSKDLADGVRDLARSLGGWARVRIKRGRYNGAEHLSWRVRVRLPDHAPPFSLPRKLARLDPHYKTTDKSMFSIEEDGEEEAVCIAVDHPTGTYVTRNYIVTHNTAFLAWDSLMAATGWHQHIRLRRNAILWISALDWKWGIGEDLWSCYEPLMPWSQIRRVQWFRQQDPQIPEAIVFHNGRTIQFKSADAKRRKYQGTPIDYFGINEEHPPDVVREGRRGLLTYGGHLLVTATPIERMRWLKELEKEPGTITTRASLTEASTAMIRCQPCGGTGGDCVVCEGRGIKPVAPPEAVAEYLGSMPEDERRLRDAGDFVNLEGLCWGAFAKATHVAEARGDGLYAGGQRLAPYPLPESWLRYGAMDFGTAHPAAVVRGVEDPITGRVWIDRCLTKAGIAPSHWGPIVADEILPLQDDLVCDHDRGDRTELELAGVATQAAIKGKDSVNAGVLMVNRWFHQRLEDGHPRLMFVSDDHSHHQLGRCDGVGPPQIGLAEQVEDYSWAKTASGILLNEPQKLRQDSCDALRYLIVHLEHGRLSPDFTPVRWGGVGGYR